MGKKGFSRKAFLRQPAAGTEEVENEAEVAATRATDVIKQVPSEEKVPEVDPSSKFLSGANVSAEDASPANGKSKNKKDPKASVALEISVPTTEEVEKETKGQLMQRHKRELKALKDTAKKMGKKRKDEVETLENEMESRHEQEWEAWNAANPDSDAEKDKTVLSTTSGLYDLTIGGEDEKPATLKQTKAQKRREQRAAEEAEREARIAEEQAKLGPSERETEAAALAQTLGSLGLQILDIPADGHCMYRAIGDQLRQTGDDSERDVQQLREEAASYIRAFPNEFYPFIAKEDSGKDQEQQVEEYCCTIEDTAAWGGQVELQALAQSLERPIFVHSVGMPIVELGKEFAENSEAQPLRVCYLRHAFGLGEHYNSTRSLTTTQEQ